MIENIAFVAFFALWIFGPPVAVYRSWNTPSRWSTIVGATGLWLLAFMALFFMHHITYGGIAFWAAK